MEFEGLDTETLLGYSKIIATSKEYKEIDKFDDIIDFLFQEQYRKKTFMLWNLRFDSQAMLKFLFIENYDTWYDIGKQIQTFEGYKYNDNYTIVYIPNKMLKFSIGKKHVVKMYDIAQFYEWSKLEDMSKMYLNTKKQDSAKWVNMSIKYTDGKIKINQLENYYKKNVNEIGLYCQDDAFKTLELTKYMRDSFISFGYPFENPLSSAKLAELYQTRNYQYPQISDKMSKTHEFVKQSFHGGMFESRIRGFIDQEIFEYDINSAYPSAMVNLEHLANGKLWTVKEPTDKANMGWYLCDFDCKYIPVQKDIPYNYTILLNLYNGIKQMDIPISKTTSFYCTGLRRQIITKIEYDFLLKHGFKVINHGGIEWYKLTNEYEKPFEWMIKAYELRREIKLKSPNDIRQKTLKKMYNSCYGKTAQQKHGYSKMTNFFYASYITAACRINMAEIAIQNEKDVIEIATDGIYLLKNLHIPNSSKLGEYETQVYEKGLFVGSGMKQLFYDNKKFSTNIRGISNDRSFDLIDLFKKNKNLNEIVFWKTRPIHLNECLIQINKRSLHDLNQFQKVGRKLSVNTDKKHHWSITYNNFNELLHNISYAIPLTVNEVNKIYVDYKDGIK